jgi:hypothetical protein
MIRQKDWWSSRRDHSSTSGVSRCSFDARRPFGGLHPRLHDSQPHNGSEVVISRDAVVPLEAAAKAAMDDDVLALRTRERTHGRHRCPTRAGTVAGPFAVDVARVQAARAMIAVLATVQRPPYECPAVPAAKLFARSLKTAHSSLISKCPRHGVLRLSRRPSGRHGDRGHAAIRVTMCRARTMGVSMLQLLFCSDKTIGDHRIRSVNASWTSCSDASEPSPTPGPRRLTKKPQAPLRPWPRRDARERGTSERTRQETQRPRPTSWQWFCWSSIPAS